MQFKGDSTLPHSFHFISLGSSWKILTLQITDSLVVLINSLNTHLNATIITGSKRVEHWHWIGVTCCYGEHGKGAQQEDVISTQPVQTFVNPIPQIFLFFHFIAKSSLKSCWNRDCSARRSDDHWGFEIIFSFPMPYVRKWLINVLSHSHTSQRWQIICQREYLRYQMIRRSTRRDEISGVARNSVDFRVLK